MKLSDETIKSIEAQIETHDICGGYEDGLELELSQGDFLILVTFCIYADLVEEYNYHSEVPYNNIEDLSYWEFGGAEINEIVAFDGDGEEVEIENVESLKY